MPDSIDVAISRANSIKAAAFANFDPSSVLDVRHTSGARVRGSNSDRKNAMSVNSSDMRMEN